MIHQMCIPNKGTHEGYSCGLYVLNNFHSDNTVQEGK